MNPLKFFIIPLVALVGGCAGPNNEGGQPPPTEDIGQVHSAARTRYTYPKPISDMDLYFSSERRLYKDVIPLELMLNLDAQFTITQKKLLAEALSIFMDRALQKNVLDCAFRKAQKDEYSPSSLENFEKTLWVSLYWRVKDELIYPGHAFVARIWDEGSTLGLGFLTRFNNEHFHIAINSDYLDSSTYGKGKNAEHWAGVMAHEFLHNLGYNHPATGKWEHDYPGRFIYEYGRCVETNGTEEMQSDDLESQQMNL